MKVLSHASLLVVAIGGLVAAANASAADVTYYQSSTVSGNCQSFEPGVTNTLRNRALGVENVGSSTLGMACSFEPQTTASASSGIPTSYTSLDLWFHGTPGQVVTCTVLTGHYWSASSFMSKSVTLNSSGDGSLVWNSGTTNWNTTTGKYGLSATCMLPPGVWATNSHFGYVSGNGA